MKSLRSSIILILTLFGVITHAIGQTITANGKESQIRADNIEIASACLWSGWYEMAPPLSAYTKEQITRQKKINQQCAKEYVLSFMHYPDEYLFTSGNENIPIQDRFIDNEDITPFTWKWLTFQMKDLEGNVLIANLRRPNWWILQNNAGKTGNIVYLSMPEMAVEGYAQVTGIHPSFIDTRISVFEVEPPYVYRPITGWFQRIAGNTCDFVFSNGDTIGATKNHPFYSEDRKAYVEIGELEIGERAKAKDNSADVLVQKIDRNYQVEKVFNLEVWRDHNYLVGSQGFLVHNAYKIKICLPGLIDKLKETANFVLAGTGKYKNVGGHHPLAKKAFEGSPKYDIDEAFSVSIKTLEEGWKLGNPGVAPSNLHSQITGKQNTLYSAWKSANPNKTMTLDDMVKIEIQALKDVQIPEDVATGWVVKALEDIKAQGTEKITNIPWNGVNP